MVKESEVKGSECRGEGISSNHYFLFQEKCADYLPQLEVSDCHRLFGDFQVTLKSHEVREKYLISSLQLKVF